MELKAIAANLAVDGAESLLAKQLTPQTQEALVAAFMNYLIFFGPEIIYEARHRGEVSARRKRFAQQSRSEAEPLHKCAVCGATELSDPNLDFRVARDGEEYCIAHLPRAESPAR